MKSYGAIALIAILAMATPGYPQTESQMKDSASPDLSDEISVQEVNTIRGRISEVDLANGTLTLDDGRMLALPPSFMYTSFPAVGQEVEVYFFEDGGHQVVHSIEVRGE